MPQARALACSSLISGSGRRPESAVGLPEKSSARLTDKAPGIFGRSSGAAPASSKTSSRTTDVFASRSRVSSSTVISVLARASFTGTALRRHGRAVEDAAAAAVILDALMLHDAVVPDRQSAARPAVAGGGFRRFDHVEQDAENILTHDPADAFDVICVGLVDRDPFAAGRRMHANQRRFEGRHAQARILRFLRI